jgi:hypothetical protein
MCGQLAALLYTPYLPTSLPSYLVTSFLVRSFPRSLFPPVLGQDHAGSVSSLPLPFTYFVRPLPSLLVWAGARRLCSLLLPTPAYSCPPLPSPPSLYGQDRAGSVLSSFNNDHPHLYLDKDGSTPSLTSPPSPGRLAGGTTSTTSRSALDVASVRKNHYSLGHQASFVLQQEGLKDRSRQTDAPVVMANRRNRKGKKKAAGPGDLQASQVKFRDSFKGFELPEESRDATRRPGGAVAATETSESESPPKAQVEVRCV